MILSLLVCEFIESVLINNKKMYSYLIDENKSVYLRGYREVLNSQSQVHITIQQDFVQECTEICSIILHISAVMIRQAVLWS